MGSQALHVHRTRKEPHQLHGGLWDCEPGACSHGTPKPLPPVDQFRRSRSLRRAHHTALQKHARGQGSRISGTHIFQDLTLGGKCCPCLGNLRGDCHESSSDVLETRLRPLRPETRADYGGLFARHPSPGRGLLRRPKFYRHGPPADAHPLHNVLVTGPPDRVGVVATALADDVRGAVNIIVVGRLASSRLGYLGLLAVAGASRPPSIARSASNGRKRTMHEQSTSAGASACHCCETKTVMCTQRTAHTLGAGRNC